MTQLLLCLDLCISAKKSEESFSFLVNVLEFLKGRSFEVILHMLPLQIQSRIFLSLLTFSLVQHFESVIWKCVEQLKVTEKVKPKIHNPADIMSAVQRFVGWAVKSKRDVLQKHIYKL